MKPTAKHGGGSIRIWGYIAADGVSEVFVCDGPMKKVYKCS